MAEIGMSIFISYPRADYRFVDRLDADLRTRGFRTWVDRHRLLVGQPWRKEITSAIEQCSLFLLVLTPNAVNPTSYVGQEVEHAVLHNKRILSLELAKLNNYQSRPPWLAAIEQDTQIADFTNDDAYDVDLNKLCYAIDNPTISFSTDYDELYHRAMRLRASNPEGAAIILHYVVDSHPNFFGGQVKDDLAALELQLYPSRVERLCAQALEARQQGQYGVEARSLEILLSLGDGNAEAVAWAREFLPPAQQNSEMLGYYVEVQRLLKEEGDRAQAGENLRNLYKRAPYFGDPAGIARELEVELPAPYLDDRIAGEKKLFQSACDLLQKEIPPSKSAQNVRSVLGELTFNLPDATTFVDAIVKGWVDSRHFEEEARYTGEKGREGIRDSIGESLSPLFGLFLFLEVGAIVVGAIGRSSGGVFSLIWVPVVICVALEFAYFLFLALGAMLRVAGINHEARQAKADAYRAFERWRQVAEQVLAGRIATIQRLHGFS